MTSVADCGLRRCSVSLWVVGAVSLVGWADEPDAPREIVRVNGDAITTADLDFAYLWRQVSTDRRSALREGILQQLVDERLMAGILAHRRAQPNPVELEAQIERIHGLIRKKGEDPAEVLARLGFDEESLRRTLSLPLAWKAYVQRLVTERKLAEYFEAHRRELDGTQIRARHVLIKLPADADEHARQQAVNRLTALRTQIASGAVTFADAAREHSQAPSGPGGGDVGFFPHRGVMPAEFSDAAFRLAKGRLSEPVRTAFGMHLIEVTDEKPGQLSLEDVRDEVFGRISRELWDRQVAQERANAKIVWNAESE